MSAKAKMWLYRIITVVVLIAIAAVMFVIGRGHTLYFDNKTAEIGGTEYKAFYKVEIYDGEEMIAKLMSKERGMDTCIGQKYKLVMDITEQKGGDPVRKEIELTLPYSLDGVIINLPALAAGLDSDGYMSEFIPSDVVETEAEEETDEFGLGDF